MMLLFRFFHIDCERYQSDTEPHDAKCDIRTYITHLEITYIEVGVSRIRKIYERCDTK